MRKIKGVSNNEMLVTAFVPFNKRDSNVSLRVLNELDNSYSKLTLPVEYGGAFDALKKHLLTHDYKAIILTGEAIQRECLTVEKIAINYNNSMITDNNGKLLSGVKILKNGPDGYFCTLPIEDYGAKISLSAGGYVCNDLYYRTLNHIKTLNLNIGCMFVHFPVYKESLSLEFKNILDLI